MSDLPQNYSESLITRLILITKIYRLLYQAMRKGKGITYLFFLFWFGLEVLGFIFWGIGIRGSGMGGFLWMIWLFDKDQNIVGVSYSKHFNKMIIDSV